MHYAVALADDLPTECETAGTRLNVGYKSNIFIDYVTNIW